MSVAPPKQNSKQQSSFVNEEKTHSAQLGSSGGEAIGRPKSWLASVCGLATMAMLWLSFPPIGFWCLAWFAPIPLIWLCGIERLPGTRPYLALWMAGFAFWLGTFYFIPIPHWALWFGWLTVSAYLGLYTVLFVGATRSLVHGCRVPLWIAAPVAWTGVEWMRCNFLTGMGMVCLSHSNYEQPILIQVADLFGGYTLTFVMILFATSLIGIPVFASCCERKTSWMHAITVVGSITFVLGYGQFRLHESVAVDPTRKLNICLIQGSVDTNLNAREDERQQKFDQCCKLTWRARRENDQIDLIIWPEANFPIYDVIPVDGKSPELFRDYDAPREILSIWQYASGFPKRFPEPTAMLVGTFGSYKEEDAYNSAVLLSDNGEITERYFKNHRVMFGEYFPILEWIPGFNNYFPASSAGKSPIAMNLRDIRLAPSICFETTVPHLIRKHTNQLAEKGNEPDAMINLTNDGWFYGTSCLDFHLACNVFRAVEMRKTNLVCANTGLSAEIDTCGRILQQGPRRDTQFLFVELTPASRSSVYRIIGDWIPMTMAAICFFGLVIGWRKSYRSVN